MQRLSVRTVTLFTAYGLANALAMGADGLSTDRRVLFMILGVILFVALSALRAFVSTCYDAASARASAVFVPALCTIKALEFTAGLFAANMLTGALRTWSATTYLAPAAVAFNGLLLIYGVFALLARAEVLYRPHEALSGELPP